MRSKILVALMLSLAIIAPSVVVAEPTYEVKTTSGDKEFAKNIRNIIKTDPSPTKAEIAKLKIKEYNIRLEAERVAEAKRIAEAAAQQKAAERAKMLASGGRVLPESNVCVVAMKSIFPEHLWRMGYAIMRAESGARPDAIGGPNFNGTHDFGCWQINNTHRALDPMEGTRIAWFKYNHSGWNPWTVYRTGAYQRFF